MKKTILLFLFCCSTLFVYAQNETVLATNLGQIIQEMSQEVVNAKKIENLLLQLGPNHKSVTALEVDYSIYPGFEGVKTYYTAYNGADDPRLSADALAKDGQQKYYSIDLITDVSYTVDENQKVHFEQSDNAYNIDLKSFDPYCTRPMTYKNGKTDSADSVLKSCIYVNPDSKRMVFIWVVCALPVNTKEGNTIKQIKIQSRELY